MNPGSSPGGYPTASFGGLDCECSDNVTITPMRECYLLSIAATELSLAMALPVAAIVAAAVMSSAKVPSRPGKIGGFGGVV